MRDVFKPRNEPARSIYEAFQMEAMNRKGRSVDEWQTSEREAVLREATVQAQRLGLRAPSMDVIVQAERSAMGHIDYGAKWAYQVTEYMTGAGSMPIASYRRGS